MPTTMCDLEYGVTPSLRVCKGPEYPRRGMASFRQIGAPRAAGCVSVLC